MQTYLLKEIRKIIAAYDAAEQTKEKLALASVVNIEESSYRRIGARMLVSSSGQWVGGISGGCLEGDALRRSQQAIYNDQPTTITYDTLEDDSNQIGVGLGCNGKIDVLFNPINYTDTNNPIEQLRQIAQSGHPAILLTIIESNEQYLGQSIIADENLSQLDFCRIEALPLSHAIKETRLKRRPQIINITNKDDQSLKVLVEYIKPETKLVLIGDNYDVISMAGIAQELGWEVSVVCRKKKLSKEVYHKAHHVYEYEELAQVKMDDYTAVILMSHDFNWDKKLLPAIMKSDAAYIGMLGPKKRLIKMESELNINLSQNSNFYSPVGLDIGAETPEEIALSIASEIVAFMRHRNGQPLRTRKGTIHERG